MEDTLKVKTFNCLSHPSETISRISKNSDSTQILFCVECILEMESNEKGDLIQLSKYFQELQALEQTSVKISGKVPDSLQETMSSQEQVISKYKSHLDQEKAKINQSFDTLLQKVTDEITKIKEKINQDLDTQLNLCQGEYTNFESKLYKYFGGDQDEERRRQRNKFSKENLSASINACETTLEFEGKIRELIREAADAKSVKDESTILSELKEQSIFLNQIAANLPQATILDQENQEKTKQIIDECMSSITNLSQISNSLEPVSQYGKLTKSIIKKIKDLTGFSKRFQLKLLLEIDENDTNGQENLEELSQVFNHGEEGIRIIYAETTNSQKLVSFNIGGQIGLINLNKKGEITNVDFGVENPKKYGHSFSDGIHLSQTFQLFGTHAPEFMEIFKICAEMMMQQKGSINLSPPTGIMGIDAQKVQGSIESIPDYIHSIQHIYVYGNY